MMNQDFIGKMGLPKTDQILAFLGRQAGTRREFLGKGVKAFFKRAFLFLRQSAPSVAQFDGLARIAQFEEMALDGIAVDFKGGRGFDNIAVVNDEPVKEIMFFQIIGKKAPAPQAV